MRTSTKTNRQAFPFDIKRLLYSIAILVLAFYISNNWFQLMLIQGESMEPAYHQLQLVVLDKNSESFSSADVIAFRCDRLSANLVKRIAACPGDTVCIRDQKLLVNGTPVAAFSGHYEYAGLLETPIMLGPDQYFVLGDNIPHSKDSRYPEVGLVTEQSILGVVLWPKA